MRAEGFVQGNERRRDGRHAGQRPRPLVGGLLLGAFALLAAACGSRLPEDALAEYDARQTVSARGQAAAPGETGDGALDTFEAATGDVGGGAANDSGTSGAGGGATDPSAAGQATPTDSGGGQTPTEGGDQEQAQAASCSGGATDIGVTENEIVVASMVTDSGPLPGATAGAYRGAASYFAKLNAEGGICGRKITVLKGDDGLDPARARAEFTRLEPQVLAFVGNLSVADSGFIDLIEETGVPYIGGTVDPAGRDLPSVVPHVPSQNLTHSAPFAYYRQAEPDVTNLAFLFSDVGGVRSNIPGAKQALQVEGYEIVYESGVNVAAPDYTSEVINMRSNGAEFAYLFAFEINMQVRMARSMRQQNFDPPLKLNTIGYHSRLIPLLGDTAEGWASYIQYVPIINEDEIQQNPALAEFRSWIDRLFPGETLDLFPVGGWGDSDLLAKALRAMGPEVTRQKVIDIIDNQIAEHDGGGLEPNGPVGEISPCYVMVEVVDQKWVREHPKSGYECELGQFVEF